MENCIIEGFVGAVGGGGKTQQLRLGSASCSSLMEIRFPQLQATSALYFSLLAFVFGIVCEILVSGFHSAPTLFSRSRSLPENFENFQKRYYYGWACNVNYLTTVWVCIKLRNVLEKELHQAALCVPAWNSYINHEEYSAFHADARLSSKAPFGAAASSSFNAQ